MYGLADIARITDGYLDGDGSLMVAGIATDSRKVTDDSLFVAIKGERYDGHNYITEALRKGALAVLVERDVAVKPKIIVDDSIRALGKIAHDYIKRFDLKKIGITGTNGKTTTKALIGSILKRQAPACVAERSYNNAIGIPLTIFRLDSDDRYLVLEYGSNHPGEIENLLGITVPDVGILTNIGPGHLEGFGSIENVRKEKLNLLKGIGPYGFTIFPEGINRSSIKAKYLTFGIGRGDINAADVVYDEHGSRFTVSGCEFRLRLLGPGNIMNGLAAIAAARVLDVSDEKINEGLYDCRPVPGRLVLLVKGGVKIIDDSYNSNPISLKEAICVISHIKAERRIAVLGDMLELGPDSPLIHQRLGREMKSAIDTLVTYGDVAANFIKGFGNGKHFDNKSDLIGWLNDTISKGDVILIKGSRRMTMEEIIKGLGA